MVLEWKKNIEIQTSFHHGKQHGFLRYIRKYYTYQHQCLPFIMDAMLVRVNDLSPNRNIGKYKLSHI